MRISHTKIKRKNIMKEKTIKNDKKMSVIEEALLKNIGGGHGPNIVCGSVCDTCSTQTCVAEDGCTDTCSTDTCNTIRQMR
jgi:hypothetical protein